MPWTVAAIIWWGELAEAAEHFRRLPGRPSRRGEDSRTAIKIGAVSTEAILRRSTKANAIEPTYQAVIDGRPRSEDDLHCPVPARQFGRVFGGWIIEPMQELRS